MIKNYFITALRNLIKSKGLTAINIFGLATGLASCLLITLYVGHEFSYESFHQNADKIYRLNVKIYQKSNISHTPISAPAMAVDIKAGISEVENYIRIMEFGGSFKYNEKTIVDNKVLIADSSFLNIFSYEMLQGNPKTALTDPFSIVLSEKMAAQIFGNENPVGKTLDVNNGSYLLKVTGVIKNPPSNSIIDFNALISFNTLYKIKTGTLTEWDGNFSFQTFLLLKDTKNIASIEKQINGLADKIINPKLKKFDVKLECTLQPIKDIHLYTNLEYERPGVAKTLYIFSAIALFILFIAGFNFVNFSIAQSTRRAKEIGIRMTTGANKWQIRLQFLGETILLCVISALISLLLVEMIIPHYNALLGMKLNLYLPVFRWLQLSIPVFVVLFGFMAGIYPALILSSYKPISVLKSAQTLKSNKSILRNGTVTLQFIISSILIICTIIVFLQLEYLEKKDLGFNYNNLVTVTISGKESWNKAEMFKNELKNISDVEYVSYATETPGGCFTQNGYKVEGTETPVMIRALGMSHDYIKTLGIKMVQGRDFSLEYPTDSNAVIINQTLVKQLGWTDAIGKKITREKEFKVIGVIQDFHFRSMHNPVEPLIMFLPFKELKQSWKPSMHIRIKDGTNRETLNKIEKSWKSVFPNTIFSYYFVSNVYKNHYNAEIAFAKLFIYFTILAIIISCLGLLGLSNLNLKAKTKEISIRKVMGASLTRIIKNLVLDYTKWALLANFFAWPVAWYFMNKWLSNFPYHITMPLWVFVVTAIALFLISMATIIIQTLKAARINAAQTLKYE